MTGPAGLSQVDSFKGKIRFRVIELYFIPPVWAMAACTTFFTIIFIIHVRFMDVRMTIGTAGANFSEVPAIALFMTGKTGCCQVSARQLKNSPVMPFNGKLRPVKSKGRMTIGTIGRTALVDKLLVVVI